MFTFLHVADIHLDSPLKGLDRYHGAPVEAVRAATRRALERLVDYALDEAVPLLVVAGDVFDGDWTDFQTGLHFASQMRRLRDGGARVLMVRGNHDAQSAMTKELSLPDNVTVLAADAPQTVVLDDLGAAVHGQSYAVRDVSDNLVPAYPDRVPGLFNIGLLHTAVTGTEGHANYAPCRLDQLVAKGYDYWALGHVHDYKLLNESPPVVYSGNIQGRNIRETGAKGCVRVDVDAAGAPAVSRVPLDVMRWTVLEVDVAGAKGLPAVADACGAALDAALGASDGLPLAVRVVLSGACPAHAALSADPEAVRSEIRARAEDVSSGRAWVEKVKLRTTPQVDVAALAASDTPQGDLLRYLDDLAVDADAFAQLGLDAELTDVRAKVRSVPGTDVTLPDLEDEAVRRALLDDARALLLPRLGGGEGGS